MGFECFNKVALDFFVSTPMGEIERIDDIDHLRFLENGVNMYFYEVESDSISVDTKKDLEYVRKMIEARDMTLLCKKGIIDLNNMLLWYTISDEGRVCA